MKKWMQRWISLTLALCMLATTALGEGVFVLPASLKVIDEEAFYGNTSIDKVIVPDGATEIRSKAFANSSVSEIELPDTLTVIEEDAFADCEEVLFVCNEDSLAYQYAQTHDNIKLQQSRVPESKHPYADNFDYTWTYDTGEDVECVTITFSADTETEEGFDFIYLYTLDDVKVGHYSGKELAGQSVTINGTGFKLRLTSDEVWVSSNDYYGFKLDNIIPGQVAPSATVKPTQTQTPTPTAIPDSLNIEVSVTKDKLQLDDSLEISVEKTGGQGTIEYVFDVYCNNVLVSKQRQVESCYSYQPVLPGNYSVTVTAQDEQNMQCVCSVTGITVAAPELVVSDLKCNSNVVMEGETIEFVAETNRDAEDLFYSASVYLNSAKIDEAVGRGKLTYQPSLKGLYSFAITITDQYGCSDSRYVDSGVHVIPYWCLKDVATNTSNTTLGETVSFTMNFDGDRSNLLYDFFIYKDDLIYRTLEGRNEVNYSLSTTEAGTYVCVCTARDSYGTAQTAISQSVVVVAPSGSNPLYIPVNSSNTLNADELNGKGENEIQVEKNDVTIVWNKLSSDSYYDLYINCSQLGLTVVNDATYTANTYTIPASQLYEGYRYSVTLERYDANGKYVSNADFDFAVKGQSLLMESSPKFVVPAKYASVNYADLNVQWLPMNYASSIEIILEYYCGSGRHEIFRQSIDGNASSFTIPQSVLMDRKMHYIKIVARDTLGYRKSSSCYFYVGCEGDDDTQDIPTPVLTSTYMTDGYYRDKIPTYPSYEPIRIEWEADSNCEYFSLHLVDYDNNRSEIVYDDIHANSYVVQPTALISGHRYRTEVYAHHTEKCYNSSDDMWFRAPYPGNLLLNPPQVTAPELSRDRNDPAIFIRQDLTITWAPVSAAKTYDVTLVLDADDCIDFEVTGLTQTSVTIPRENLWTGELYILSIDAYDSNGNSTYESYYIKLVDTNIAAPTLISPALSTDSENIPAYAEKDMELVWGAVDGAVEYRVQVRDYYGSSWDLIVDAQGITEETYTIPAKELYMGGLFRVRIKAIDEYGNGKYSGNYYFQIGSSKYLELSRSEWTFDYEGGSKNTFIHTSQQWSAKVSDSWISVSKTSGKASMQLTISTTENTGDFPRSGNVTFTNAAGGCAVFSVVQAGNGSANTGALRITSPEQGDTLQYAGFRTNWNYNYDHAYFAVKLIDVTSNKTVFTKSQIIVTYCDIAQSVLTFGHVYQLTVEAYNASYNKISQSSIVFRTEGLNSGDDGVDEDGVIIEDEEIPEGATEIIYTGISEGDTIELQDVVVSWKNVTNADYYWVALRDATESTDDNAIDNVTIMNERVDGLRVAILSTKLTKGRKYNLWIAAYKTDGTLVTGKNIKFTVAGGEETPDVDPGTGTNGIPTAKLTISDTVVLGQSIQLQGMVLANGGVLDMVRVTIQEVSTGAYCDYAIYDAAAILKQGDGSSFDLVNVYPIATGEGASVSTSGSGYARANSTTLSLTTAGSSYHIVIYGRNAGDDTLAVLASQTVQLRKADFVRVYDVENNDLNGKTLSFAYNKFSGKTIYALANIDIMPWTSDENAFDIDCRFVTYTDEGTLYELNVNGSENPYADLRTGELRIYENGKVETSDPFVRIKVKQEGNPNVPVILSAALDDDGVTFNRSNPLKVVGTYGMIGGFDLIINTQNEINTDWYVYTDDNDIATVQIDDSGMLYIQVKKGGRASIYISHIKKEYYAEIEKDHLYWVCDIIIAHNKIDKCLIVDHTLLNPSLATISVDYAKEAYSGAANVAQMLENDGFSVLIQKHYNKPKLDHYVAYSIGKKVIPTSDANKTVYAVVIRGTYDSVEWLYDFNAGTGTYHLDFLACANEIYRDLLSLQQDSDTDVRVWVTGHSRGAGVANIVAKKCFDNSGFTQVFAYTFASPAVTTQPDSSLNIHNYMDAGDLITMLPMSEWGFGVHGQIYKFGARDNSVEFLADQVYNLVQGSREKFAYLYELVADAVQTHLLDYPNLNGTEIVAYYIDALDNSTIAELLLQVAIEKYELLNILINVKISYEDIYAAHETGNYVTNIHRIFD